MVTRNVGVLIVRRHQAVDIVACAVWAIAKSLTDTQTYAQGTLEHVNNLRWHVNECAGTCNSPSQKAVGLLLMTDKRTATKHGSRQIRVGIASSSFATTDLPTGFYSFIPFRSHSQRYACVDDISVMHIQGYQDIQARRVLLPYLKKHTKA
jgi:hypothetical protein